MARQEGSKMFPSATRDFGWNNKNICVMFRCTFHSLSPVLLWCEFPVTLPRICAHTISFLLPFLFHSPARPDNFQCLTVIKIDWYLWDFIVVVFGCFFRYENVSQLGIISITWKSSLALDVCRFRLRNGKKGRRGAVISWLHCTLSWLSLSIRGD